MWYALVRFLLENLRTGNWFVGGIATAQLMSILFGLGAFLLLLYRHRRPADVAGTNEPDDVLADDFDDVEAGDEIDEEFEDLDALDGDDDDAMTPATPAASGSDPTT